MKNQFLERNLHILGRDSENPSPMQSYRSLSQSQSGREITKQIMQSFEHGLASTGKSRNRAFLSGERYYGVILHERILVRMNSRAILAGEAMPRSLSSFRLDGGKTTDTEAWKWKPPRDRYF